MTYSRVIPRDLFNEGNLLKCYGRLYINLEKLGRQEQLIHAHPHKPFMVEQDQADGSLTVTNVILVVRGCSVRLSRPLNARGSWPLYLITDDEEEIAVFNDGDGSFTLEMLRYLAGDDTAPA